MKISEFNIEKYVDSHIKCDKNIDELSLEEYDDYLENKNNMDKNVRNLLKYFMTNERKSFFSFKEQVLGYFPLEEFDENDISEFLDLIFSLKDNNNFTGNKVVYNLSKISIDNIDKQLSNKTRTFDFLYIDEQPKSVFEKRVELLKCQGRFIIRKEPYKVRKLIQNSEIELEKLKEQRILSNIAYSIDYISDLLLQIFNYWIITIEGVSFEKKINLIEVIKLYLDKYEQYILDLIKSNNVNIGFRDAVSIFTLFLSKRNEYGEYINILEKLQKEQDEEPVFFAKPEEKYKVKKGDIVLEDTIKNIITEGIQVDKYNEKLEKTKEIIKVFSKYGMRTASSNNILDLKVYFREIYLSNSKYKTQAKTIVRKYLVNYKNKMANGCELEEIVKSFEKESEYQFLREKVSRGYFRETCDINLYNEKNKLQKKLYEILLSIFLIYDYKGSITLLQKLVEELIPISFQNIDGLIASQNGQRIF